MTGRQEVARLKLRLKNVFDRAPPANAPIENQSDFAKYLCVLVAGFLEQAIVALLEDFTKRRSSPEVFSYVERELAYWTNPNVEKICQLLGSFSQAWREQAEAYFVDEKKAHVNGLIALRHKVAHGESVGTTPSAIKEYNETIGDVVEFVANLIDPQ
jgi:RiboL-PSP-HEPN